MTWFSKTANGYVVAVHAQPGAKKSQINGLHGERLKVRVAAPPLEGRANAALIDLLAERLGLPRAKLVEIADTEIDPTRLLEP